MKWRIYYGDGTTFSSEDGGPEQAPTAGVVVIAQEEESSSRGFTLAHSKDYYLWRYDGWSMADMGGLWDYLLCATGWKVVLSGRTIRNDEWHAVVGRASKEGLGDVR